MSPMDSKLSHALSMVAKDIRGAQMDLESVVQQVDAGDLSGALANLHMGVFKRLRDARMEGDGAAALLEELGAVYPPLP